MIQIQWFQAFLLVLGLIVSSIVVIASYRKTTREQQQANADNWEGAVNALRAHNEALIQRLKDAEELQSEQTRQVGMLQGSLQAIEKERRSWTARNQSLYETCQEYRSQLARLGIQTKEPNGEL